MENKVRCILVDPIEQKVEEIFLNKDNLLQEWYQSIGNNCSLVTNADYWFWDNIANGLLCDDDILIRESDIQGMFEITLGNARYNIVNKAIFCGINNMDGESVSCTLSTKLVESKIVWKSKEEALIYARQTTTRPSDVSWWENDIY
jgi:hypothetical protein